MLKTRWPHCQNHQCALRSKTLAKVESLLRYPCVPVNAFLKQEHHFHRFIILQGLSDDGLLYKIMQIIHLYF